MTQYGILVENKGCVGEVLVNCKAEGTQKKNRVVPTPSHRSVCFLEDMESRSGKR